MRKHDDECRKWEYIGHRLMQSSDLQVLCGVSRTSPGAEKPFVSGLTDDELKGMLSFVLERMRGVDWLARESAGQNEPDIPYDYRDRSQEYLRLQVPKSARYRSSELYNADFINDLDEGYDSLQGVFVTLSRALFYLFEEMHYRHGMIATALVLALQREYPEYGDAISQLTAVGEKDAPLDEHPSGIKLTLSQEQLAELSGCLDVFFNPADRSALSDLLQGDQVGRKLVFNGNQNRLVEVFRRLSYNGFLHESSTTLRDWLCGHFAYRSRTGIADLSRNSVWDILSKAKGEPTLKRRICMFDWLRYKTQAAVRKDVRRDGQ